MLRHSGALPRVNISRSAPVHNYNASPVYRGVAIRQQSFSTSVIFQFVSPHDINRVMVDEERDASLAYRQITICQGVWCILCKQAPRANIFGDTGLCSCCSLDCANADFLSSYRSTCPPFPPSKVVPAMKHVVSVEESPKRELKSPLIREIRTKQELNCDIERMDEWMDEWTNGRIRPADFPPQLCEGYYLIRQKKGSIRNPSAPKWSSCVSSAVRLKYWLFSKWFNNHL